MSDRERRALLGQEFGALMSDRECDKPAILVFGGSPEATPDWLRALGESVHLERGLDVFRPLDGGADPAVDAAVLLGAAVHDLTLWTTFENVLKSLPDGVAMLDGRLKVLWSNESFQTLVGSPPGDREFFELLGNPVILGPDFSPLRSALGLGELARTVLKVADRKHLVLHAAPVRSSREEPSNLVVVTLRDISEEMHQRQKLQAIHQAGQELGDLGAEEIVGLSVEDRIDLLKEKIIQFTQDVLEFETVEIRLLDKTTKALDPLLNVGMSDEAARRKLWAEPQANGVTGFVAATGKSYLCDDTTRDQLYLPGAPGARSSLTVPLILHGEVMGTFNVESNQPQAFHEQDLQFLELFCHEVAAALNTLELLAAEKYTALTESMERLLREVARPVDSVLNDTAWILEKYIGHDPEVCERLQRILKHVRGVRQLIQNVGETPVQGVMSPALPPKSRSPVLREKRILVVDADESIRLAAHELLGCFGCEVETAHNGEEALLMARSFPYHAVIADIRLPDMTGDEIFSRLRDVHEGLPVILMTGFGYDPSHAIVKARQMGLKSVLYKPFRPDQLVKELEQTLSAPAAGNGG